MARLMCTIETNPHPGVLSYHRRDYKVWLVEDLLDTRIAIQHRNQDWRDAIEWCGEQFGPIDGRWTGLISDVVRNYVAFVHEDDAFAFRMRWC